MYEHLKYFKQFIPSELKAKSPEAICKIYQETHDGRCIYTMFSKVFDSIYTLSKKYTTLEPDVIVSNALTCIADIMDSFDSTQKIKFDTYFSRCFERVLYAVFKPQTCKKRVCPTEVISLQDPKVNLGTDKMNMSAGNLHAKVEDYIEDFAATTSFDELELMNILETLTDKEYVNKIFILLYAGYTVKQIHAKMPEYSLSSIRNNIYKYKPQLLELIRS